MSTSLLLFFFNFYYQHLFLFCLTKTANCRCKYEQVDICWLVHVFTNTTAYNNIHTTATVKKRKEIKRKLKKSDQKNHCNSLCHHEKKILFNIQEGGTQKWK